MIRIIKNKLKLLEQRKNNNRGAALIITLVAIALLCFMVSILLTVSFYNLRMKTTDLKGKKTFYTAETAMDEIRAGLQQDISEVFAASYITTMENAVSTAADDRRDVFRTEYANKLRVKIADATNSDKYDIEHLKSFLKKTAYDDTKEIGAKLEIPVDTNVLTLTEQGFIIKDLVVKYYDEKKYVSEIKTDIILEFPEIDFSQGASAMNLLNYVIIANDTFTADGVTVHSNGSIYGGKNGAEFTSSVLDLANSASTSVKSLFVTNGNLTTKTGTIISVNDMEIWAKNMVAENSTLNVSGATYLSNDFVISNNSAGGTGTNVTLKGSYYGYGSLNSAKNASSLVGMSADIEKHPAEYSSAILVNGAKASVDLSGLEKMMIAGNSYIGASEKNDEAEGFITGKENEDVAMGESISIKSNQTAYLVPAECVAPTAANGKTNPMPASKYHDLLNELGDNESLLVDLKTTIAKKYGVTLESLGVTGCKTVCYPIQKVGSMVYLFMEFDSEASANNFFVKYYSDSGNLSKLNANLDLYATYGIKVPDDMDLSSSNSVFYYNGNIVVNEENKSSFYVNKLQTVTAEDSTSLLEQQKTYYDSFKALGTNLTKQYNMLTVEELNTDVYGNLVKTMTSTDTKKNISAGDKKVFITAGASPLGAVVVNGDYIVNSTTVTGQDSEGNTATAGLRVVIASGDVTVKSDFKGMIIAGGQIHVEGTAVNLEAAPTEVSIALNAANSDEVRPLNYLKVVQSLMIGGFSTEDGSGEEIKIADLIIYRNWKKQ